MANSFINKKVDLATTDLTTLYTVPSFKTAVVKSTFLFLKLLAINLKRSFQPLPRLLILVET